MVRKQNLLIAGIVLLLQSSGLAQATQAAPSTPSTPATRTPAMAAPRAMAQTTKPPTKRVARPPAKPVEPATEVDLPKTVPLYPGARAVSFSPYHSTDNRSYLVGKFVSGDPIEKITAYFFPKVVDELGQNGMQIRPIEPQYKFAQGWFTKERRGLYLFRVYLMSDGKQTEIKYYMERGR